MIESNVIQCRCHGHVLCLLSRPVIDQQRLTSNSMVDYSICSNPCDSGVVLLVIPTGPVCGSVRQMKTWCGWSLISKEQTPWQLLCS